MSRAVFNAGKKAVNVVNECRCGRKKLAIDKYCPDCGNAVKLAAPRKGEPEPDEFTGLEAVEKFISKESHV